jgi:hypothetical protein
VDVVNTKTLMERNTSGTNRQTNKHKERQTDGQKDEKMILRSSALGFIQLNFSSKDVRQD